MSSTRYLSCAETAKLVRAALSESFAGVKFGVRSKTYSGGASIDIKWTDGPTTAQVNAVTSAFEGSYFDGMIDYKGTLHHTIDGEPVSFGANFVFENRELSDALIARGIASVVASYGGCEPITVEQYRQGQARSWTNSGGCDMERALNLWLASEDQGMQAAKSATLARVKFAGSDEYGAPYGSNGYPRAA
jgi:hypothetical protein